MRRKLALTLLVLSSVASAALAESEVQPREPGIESKGYVWDALRPEEKEALRAKGDAARGAISFEVCQGCHRFGALGRADGSYPRLAGQHASVLIKQMSDVRAGRRDNPKMYPFVDKHVIETPQQLADIAAYLQGLPSPPDNGVGPGSALDRGRTLYEKDCVKCHHERGEGEQEKFFPRVSNQHYNYLLRQSLQIRDGLRRNANPKMVKVIKPYSDEELEAVADYMSRLGAKSTP